MEFLNELYSLKNKIDTGLGFTKIHRAKDATILEGANAITVFTKTYKYSISKTQFKIINVASDEDKAYLLCEHEEDLKYKSFIIVCKDKEISLFGIDSNKANHTVNKSFSALDDKVYLINDDNYFMALDTSNTDNLLIHDVLSYPSVNKYIANIDNYIKLDKNSYCNQMIQYSGAIYVPILNSKKHIMYEINNNIISKGEFDIGFAIPKIDSLIQLGGKNKYSDGGAVTIFTIDNKIVLMDMIDLVGNVIKTFKHDINICQDEDSTFISCNEDLYKIDERSFEISKVFFCGDILNKELCLINNRAGFYKDEYFEELYKVDKEKTSVININCINENGDTLLNRNYLIEVGTTTTIKAEDIKNYTVFGKSTITIAAKEKYYTGEFRYVNSATLYTLNVVHKCSDIMLATYSQSGIDGDTYNIKPLRIPGYLYSDSYNSTGTYNKDMETDCIINYVTDSDFTTESNHRVYICCNCYANDKLLFKKYVATTKGKNILIKAPLFPCYEPVEKNIILESIDENIVEVDVKYNKTSEGVYTEYIYNDHVLFETISPIKNDLAYINPAPYLKTEKETIKLYGRDTLKVQCNIDNQLSLFEAINYSNKETIYRIVEVGKKDVTTAPIFKKYRSIGSNSYDDLLLTINQFYYEQTEFSLFIKHTMNGKVLKEEEVKGPIGAIYKIESIGDIEIETLSPLEYSFGPIDKHIEVVYEKRKLSLTYKVIDIETDNCIMSNSIRAEKDKEITFNVKIPKEYKILYQDSYTNQDVSLTIKKNIEYVYLVYKDKYPNLTKYARGEKGITFNTKYKHRNLITVIMKDNKIITSDKEIYVVDSPNRSNESTINLLKENSIDHKVIRVCDINDLPKYSVLIDGDYSSKTKFLPNFNREDITYLSLDRTYKDFIATVKFSKYDSTNCLDKNIKKLVLKDELSIGKMYYNKNSHRLYIKVNYAPVTKNIEKYTINVYETNTLNIVHEETIKINTIGNFTKAMVSINDSLKSEPSKICGVDNISYNNVYKLPLIDEVLHCYLIDEIGNRTKTIHEPIIFNITAQSTNNNYVKEYYKHNLIKHNHRFRGPRESYKFYNSYAGSKRTLNEMNMALDNIKSNIKYKNDTDIKE